MARVTGQIHLASNPQAVWSHVSDPRRLADWWPRVSRVDLNGADGFTEVLKTEKGRDVRADFVTDERAAERIWQFSQELTDTPFERVLRSAQTTIALEPAADATTVVSLTLDRKLRGLGRFGGPIMRKAIALQINEALQMLGEIHGTVD
uniref:Unannotated protein n=1 Tax=freshwater metagenome TaxID=449393 RepID=A0A6J5ZXU3_9ZZZZ